MLPTGPRGQAHDRPTEDQRSEGEAKRYNLRTARKGRFSKMTAIFVAVFSLLVVGGVLISVLKIFGGLGKANAERERLLREGIQCPARVLGVQMGGMTMTVGVHRHLQLQLQVEVQLPGRPPHVAQMTTMVSELQIPQLQPGAQLTVRVDRNDPNKIALEGVGAQPQAAYGAPGAYGAPPQAGGYGGAYGAPPAVQVLQPGVYGAPGMPPQGFGTPGFGAPGMVPIGGAPAIPGSAKLGMWIGIGGAIVGVLVAIVVVAVNVDGVGLDSAREGNGVCAQAIRCCEIATAGNASQANCKNLGKVGVPEHACVQMLEANREMAKLQGRSCE